MTEQKCCGGAGRDAEDNSGTGTFDLQSQSAPNTQTMYIVEELNRIYEDRLQDIDEQARGDLKLKNITYKEWVEMLIRVMHYLLETFHDLENEAVQRLGLLERKLQIESRTTHPDEIGKIKSDLANLLELIRRAIDERKWNTDGLEFQTITEKDIFGNATEKCELAPVDDTKKLSSQLISQSQMIKKLESEKNALKTELEMKEIQLRKLNPGKCTKCKVPAKADDTKEKEKASSTDAEDKVFKACILELRQVLQEKEMQLADTLKENEYLKSELNLAKGQVVQKDKVITNMKALTIEVADKHDQIQQMRTQIFSLEEELKKAEKKIHFKDNVIKELRRDCKNVSKTSVNSERQVSPVRESPSPEPKSHRLEEVKTENPIKVIQPPKPRSYRPDEDNIVDLPTDRTGSSQLSNNSGCTMETVIALESCRLDTKQQEEFDRIKELQKELDELFYLKSTYDETVDDQRKIVAFQQKRVYELVQKLLCDLKAARNKLAYVRNQLMAISAPKECDSSGDDSGYNSQEDLEPESSIIHSVRGKVEYLKEENKQLKCQIEQLHNDIQSARSSATGCGKILQEVASALSSMRRKQISYDVGSIQSANGHPLCEAVSSLGNELSEKDRKIEELKKSQDLLGKELQCTKSQNSALNHETCAKDQTIFDLQETINFQSNSIQLLQSAKEQLEEELTAIKSTENVTKYTELLGEKARLETECKNLLTTVANLRQALESHKRGDSIGNTSSGGNSNSLWNWWRSSVHDV